MLNYAQRPQCWFQPRVVNANPVAEHCKSFRSANVAQRSVHWLLHKALNVDFCTVLCILISVRTINPLASDGPECSSGFCPVLRVTIHPCYLCDLAPQLLQWALGGTWGARDNKYGFGGSPCEVPAVEPKSKQISYRKHAFVHKVCLIHRMSSDWTGLFWDVASSYIIVKSETSCQAFGSKQQFSERFWNVVPRHRVRLFGSEMLFQPSKCQQ